MTVVCDLPHDGEVEGKEAVSFSFERTAHEIDVCTALARELHARVHQPRAQGQRHRRRRARTGPGRERSAEIRAWARRRGHQVGERDRIPATIIQEYEASHYLGSGPARVGKCGRARSAALPCAGLPAVTVSGAVSPKLSQLASSASRPRGAPLAVLRAVRRARSLARRVRSGRSWAHRPRCPRWDGVNALATGNVLVVRHSHG